MGLKLFYFFSFSCSWLARWVYFFYETTLLKKSYFSFELHSQSMKERATLDRYHHFHGHSGMCA